MLGSVVKTYLGYGMAYTCANWVVFGPSIIDSDVTFDDLGYLMGTSIGMGLTWPMFGKYLIFPGKYAVPERLKQKHDWGKPLEYVAGRVCEADFNHLILAAKPLLMIRASKVHDASISRSREMVSEIFKEYEKPSSRVQNP